MLGVLSWWLIPLFSSFVWLAMLLAMMLTWICDKRPYLAAYHQGQYIPYISDIGAWKLKPLFITMGTISVLTFDLAFIGERYLRHTGRLTRNTSWWQKILSILSILFSLVGAGGLILLTIFDTLRYPQLHDVFLVAFIGGYILTAIFICAEYQRLGIHYREHRILRMSFWFKLAFILVSIALAGAFGTLSHYEHYNPAAIVEWVIALVYAFFVMSFALDFLPAVNSKGRVTGETEDEKAMRESAVAPGNGGQRYNGGAVPHSRDGGYNRTYHNAV